jgi:RNA polymerase sigma factor (sigma-70 family)
MWFQMEVDMVNFTDIVKSHAADVCDADDLNEALESDDEEAESEPAPMRPCASADDPQLRAWLERIVRQDEAALDSLYRASVARVYGLALRIVRNPAIAEEVTEDTFWQIWRQAPRFDPLRGNALAWMLTITRSRALDALRVQRRINANTVSVDALGDTLEAQCEASDAENASNDPHDLLEATQGNEQLHHALAQLDPLPRQLIAMAFFKGLTHEEIVGQTGLPLGTVKTHIRRTMAVLRKYLASPSLINSAVLHSSQDFL